VAEAPCNADTSTSRWLVTFARARLYPDDIGLHGHDLGNSAGG
jgi:hypothetical protein